MKLWTQVLVGIVIGVVLSVDPRVRGWLSSDQAVIAYLWAIVHLALAVVVHEAGHGLGALATGTAIREIAAFGLAWRPVVGFGRRTVRTLKRATGYVAIIPGPLSTYRSRIIRIVAAGPAISVLTVIAFTTAIPFGGGTFAIVGAIVNALIVLLVLTPTTISGVPTDGAILWSLRGTKGEAYAALSHMLSERYRGVPTADLDPEALAQAASGTGEVGFIAHYLTAERHLDRGEFAEAVAAAERAVTVAPPDREESARLSRTVIRVEAGQGDDGSEVGTTQAPPPLAYVRLLVRYLRGEPVAEALAASLATLREMSVADLEAARLARLGWDPVSGRPK